MEAKKRHSNCGEQFQELLSVYVQVDGVSVSADLVVGNLDIFGDVERHVEGVCVTGG